MNIFVYLLYVATVGVIRVYKWIELRILLLFNPWFKAQAKKICAEIGVVLHIAGDAEFPANPAKDPTAKKYSKLIHLNIIDDRFFVWAANTGTLGGGEAFMYKLWDVFDDKYEDMTEFVTRIFENNILDYYYHSWNKLLEYLELYAFNLQSGKRAFQVGKQHYDLGNDLYQVMLDPWMQYTCGYWKDVDNLNDAQINKMELIAKKLDLKPGMKILDIGCGFGTLCKYLAENYNGVTCVGITISVEQAKYGQKSCEGLPVDIRLQDYREVTEKFDRIVSVGMFEHVGHKNFHTFMQVANRCLKDDGILLLQTIGRNHINQQRSDPWSDKYIFPNGMVPNVREVAKMTQGLFIIEDWHNFSLDYAKTLYAWRENFIRGWPKLKEKYDGERFFRMWICYLSCARAFFKSRKLQLWQIVMTKDGLKREYRAAR